MQIKQQTISLYTLIRREVVRMFRIANQVFLPPVITTSLYFLIFGNLNGDRIGPINGYSYSLFIAPGLIMMAVVINSYSNVSTSLFNVRFQRSIEEILVSPMYDNFLLLGYVLGGVLRGIIVSILVYCVSFLFLKIHFCHFFLTILIILLVSTLFSLAGFTNAIIARNFDDVMIVPTFILTPLTYLGGIFYTIHMLSPFWRTISYFNPIIYMVNALRYAMIGYQELNIRLSLLIIFVIITFLIFINKILLNRGVGLRE